MQSRRWAQVGRVVLASDRTRPDLGPQAAVVVGALTHGCSLTRGYTPSPGLAGCSGAQLQGLASRGGMAVGSPRGGG